MHSKSIIKPKHQIETKTVTYLTVGIFYLDEEVLQVEFWPVLAKGSFTELLELMVLAQPAQNITKSIQRNFGTFLQSYSDISKLINQHKIDFKRNQRNFVENERS
jgi:hypothetical protein